MRCSSAVAIAPAVACDRASSTTRFKGIGSASNDAGSNKTATIGCKASEVILSGRHDVIIASLSNTKFVQTYESFDASEILNAQGLAGVTFESTGVLTLDRPLRSGRFASGRL